MFGSALVGAIIGAAAAAEAHGGYISPIKRHQLHDGQWFIDEAADAAFVINAKLWVVGIVAIIALLVLA